MTSKAAVASRMNNIIPGLIPLFLILAAHSAQASESVLADMSHASWTGRDEAPQGINALAQTTDGYLWIGTSSGLYRFDGLRFFAYIPPADGPQFNSLDIVTLAADAQDGLWMGFRVGGVSYLKGGRLTNYDDRSGLVMSFVQQILPQAGNEVWAVTAGRLMKREGGRWRDIGPLQGLPSDTVQSAFFDRSGGMWVGADHVYFRPSGKSQFTATAEKVKAVTQFVQSPEGAIWISDGWTSVRPVSGAEKQKPGLHLRGTSNFLFDQQGNLWNANDYFGLDVIARTSLLQSAQDFPEFESEHFDRTTGLTSKACRKILADREGNIWVGTEAGLDRFQQARFRPVKDLPIKSFPALAAGQNGGVWIAGLGTPLFGIENGTPSPHGAKRGWGPIYRDQKNIVWQYDYWQKELSTYDGEAFTHVEVPPILEKKVVQCLAGNNAGDVFASFEHDGIWHRRDEKWEQLPGPATPPRLALSLLADSSGRLWAGYPKSEIALFEGRNVRRFIGGALADLGSVMTLYESAGQIWAGGTNGVVLYTGSGFRRLRIVEGVDVRGISGIVKTGEGDLWLNAASGIVRIASTEIERFLRQPDYRMQVEILDFRDGVSGTPAQLRPTPTVIADSTGRLWFATEGSIVSVDPASFKKQRALPRVMVESLRSEGVERPFSSSNRIAVRARNLEINYVGISLTSPQRVTYRYKLDGEDTQWQDAGARRQALYTSLAPGRYRFHVAASIGDGRWSEFDFPAEVVVPQAFYQTAWFLIACVMTVIAILVVSHELRVQHLTNKIRERLDERLAERVRIARDLHDTLLQGIQGLILRFHCVAGQLPASDPMRSMMDEALDTADRIIEEGRDSVRGLRSDLLCIDDLASELTGLGTSLNRDAGVHFGVSTEGQPVSLHQIVGNELCMIGREAIANAFRHAGASRISVEINSDGSAVRLRCRDNGRGIDPGVLKGGKGGHWGLIGMRERAEKIGASFECWSAPAQGTEITVTVLARGLKDNAPASILSVASLAALGRLFRRRLAPLRR